MFVLRLAIASLWNRRFTALLTVLAIATSVALLLGVEKVRTSAKASFANTISGTDLIVGARSGSTQLLLYSVFRIGNATNNISWASYRELSGHKDVAWTIPMSLGDSHRGYRVLGTNQDYFRHYRYGRKQNLEFAEGEPFDDLFDVVIGSEVAQKLGYELGQQVVIAHGLGAEGFLKHDNLPFSISGILKPTGTPVDRTIHVSLEAIEAIHVDWRNGTPTPGMSVTVEKARAMGLQPNAITAALFGLKSRFATFGLQREINEYRREPLLAILPGVALQELWDLMGTAESALAGISIAVVISGLLGMTIMLLAGLNERRREMAILRSVGARPGHILGLLVAEAGFLTFVGALSGMVILYVGMALAQPWIATTYGLYLEITAPSARDLTILGAVIAAGFVAGLLPAAKACRQSLADGMIVRS